ncbi:NUDIX domain-containing protein [Dyadobacter arcticus]|uniref:ADP-ribose pyrophosphatase YjhB (NUDIX family) n=1 Tax=Dyadobacter arcticus TaxID=1078754 RepID=A0ABX0UQ74_9BACT|nr:NUDIX domain-containing protein [Dyadobacter arcticus]NIJ53705.1 ADP-ribose pyrophosphatase YjhB (NUDIX family) [Dyadobacter arcticus]
MQTVKDEIGALYGGSVRVRVCGICVKNERILVVNHSLYGKNQLFWSPPGGGIQYGETAVDALKREFEEETGLKVQVGSLLFIHEHIGHPLHAIELFFRIDSFEGTLVKGSDPEITSDGQIIEEVSFMSWTEIQKFEESQLHRLFSLSDSLEGIFNLGNYISDSTRD